MKATIEWSSFRKDATKATIEQYCFVVGYNRIQCSEYDSDGDDVTMKDDEFDRKRVPQRSISCSTCQVPLCTKIHGKNMKTCYHRWHDVLKEIGCN